MEHDSESGLTRRDLLEHFARVGGVAAVYAGLNAYGIQTASATETPPELRGSGKGKKIVILGAGHAGNTAAFELSKLGYEVTVLEARSFAGGRAQSARKANAWSYQELGGELQKCEFDDGQYINLGPWRIPYWHRSTLYYCKQFGVPVEIMVNNNDAAYIAAKNIQGGLANKRVRQFEVKADMGGYASEIVAKAANTGKLDAQLSGDDKELFIEFFRRYGALGKDLTYKGADGRGRLIEPGAGLDPGPGKLLPPYAREDVFKSKLWSSMAAVANHEMQVTMFQPVGGMDQIAAGFTRNMGHLIKYNIEVEKIIGAAPDSKEATINYIDTKSGQRGTITADYVVCTIPLPVLHQLNADFSADFRQAMTGCAYAVVGKAGLQMKTRFWEDDPHWIYGGHVQTVADPRFGNYTVSLPSAGYLGKKGVLLGAYINGVRAAEVSAMSLKDRMEYFLDAGETMFPGEYRKNFETGFSWFWHKAKYNQGGWAQWPADGLKNAYPKLLEAQGRVYLAGEHLSYLTGWQAGAIESAWQQIAKLHNRAVQA